MKDDEQQNNNDRLAMIGRSMAFLCLARRDLHDKDLATQCEFLEALGLFRKEASQIFGTPYAFRASAHSLAYTSKFLRTTLCSNGH